MKSGQRIKTFDDKFFIVKLSGGSYHHIAQISWQLFYPLAIKFEDL